jgi:hypothetical protein
MKNRSKPYQKYFHLKCTRQCNPRIKNILKITISKTTAANIDNKAATIHPKISSKSIKDKSDSTLKIEGSMTLNVLIKMLKNSWRPRGNKTRRGSNNMDKYMVQIFSKSNKIRIHLAWKYKIIVTVKIGWLQKVLLRKDRIFKLRRNNKKKKAVKEGGHKTNWNK